MASRPDRQVTTRLVTRLVTVACLVGLPVPAALLHEALGPFVRLAPRPYVPTDPELMAEFGLEEAEEADFRTDDGRSARVRAMQFYDDTGAISAYSWLRPSGATEVERGERAVEKDGIVLIHFANYLMSLEGDLPDDEDIELALAYLPRPKPTADPPVLQYVPEDRLIPDSGRQILGPVALGRIAPELAPSVVGFHFGPEGHYGRYAAPGGELRMIIWAYPSNPIARGQVNAFHGVPALVAKQDGPLIASVLAPASSDDAQRLLAGVRYRAEVTQHVEEPRRHDSLSNIILDTFVLCGLLACLMILGGVLVAVTRRIAGRVAPESIIAAPHDAGMQRLGIDSPMGLSTANQPARRTDLPQSQDLG